MRTFRAAYRRWLVAPVALVAFAAFVAFAMMTSILVPRLAMADDPNAGLPKAGAVTVDRETPRKAASGFFQAARTGNYTRAAYYLDLRGIPAAEQADRGPKLAEQLFYVLTHEKVDAAKLPDTPDGSDATGKAPTDPLTATSLYIGEEPVPISFIHVRFDDGISRWLIARTTVSMIPELDDAYGPKGWRTKLPAWLTGGVYMGNELWQWLGLVALVFLSYFVGRVASYVIVAIGSRLAKNTALGKDNLLILALRRPLRTIFAATLFRLAMGELDLTVRVSAICSHFAYTALVIAVAWLILRVLGVASNWLLARASSGPTDGANGISVEHRSRAVRTQLTLIRRLATVLVTIVTTAVIALQFEFVRSVGVSLLASAGILGVVLGFAAQKSLAGVIAGIQLFIAQPVRIGDSVEIEGESGTMEALNLTYAVVRLWDERRMVVPIAKLLDTSFKNLSLAPNNLLGAVELVIDPATPVEAVRAQLVDICTASPKWDKSTCVLQVVDANEKGAKIRALVSSSNANDLFLLRCEIREKLLAFLRDLDNGRYYANQRHHPSHGAPVPPVPGASRPSLTTS